MKLSFRKYVIDVQVQASKTYCTVHTLKQVHPDQKYVLSVSFKDLRAKIGQAVGLAGSELDLFIQDHQRRITGLSTVGTKGQWDYVKPIIQEWLTQLHQEVETIVQGLNVAAYAVRVEIATPFSKLCPVKKYYCKEQFLSNQEEVCLTK